MASEHCQWKSSSDWLPHTNTHISVKPNAVQSLEVGESFCVLTQQDFPPIKENQQGYHTAWMWEKVFCNREIMSELWLVDKWISLWAKSFHQRKSYWTHFNIHNSLLQTIPSVASLQILQLKWYTAQDGNKFIWIAVLWSLAGNHGGKARG